MEQAIDGVYSRMHGAMIDHRQGTISFVDMLQLWKQEMKLIREQEERKFEEGVKVVGSEAA